MSSWRRLWILSLTRIVCLILMFLISEEERETVVHKKISYNLKAVLGFINKNVICQSRGNIALWRSRVRTEIDQSRTHKDTEDSCKVLTRGIMWLLPCDFLLADRGFGRMKTECCLQGNFSFTSQRNNCMYNILNIETQGWCFLSLLASTIELVVILVP